MGPRGDTRAGTLGARHWLRRSSSRGDRQRRNIRPSGPRRQHVHLRRCGGERDNFRKSRHAHRRGAARGKPRRVVPQRNKPTGTRHAAHGSTHRPAAYDAGRRGRTVVHRFRHDAGDEPHRRRGGTRHARGWHNRRGWKQRTGRRRDKLERAHNGGQRFFVQHFRRQGRDERHNTRHRLRSRREARGRQHPRRQHIARRLVQPVGDGGQRLRL